MAGTLVTTKEGLKPIEEVKIGEYVLSRNEESGETSYKKVTDTLIRSTYNICTIELENGKIKSTTGHLFMVKDKWWKAAAELKAGDILETADGKCKVVKSITVEEKGYPVTTYNLSVEDNHTFFVGKLGVLTHNMKGFTPCELADEVAEKATKGGGNPVENSGRKFWTNKVEHNGTKVYQRNDIIDPGRVDKMGRTNIERMEQGLAPLGPDGKSVNLHHMTQTNDSAIAEVTQRFHQQNKGIIHINPNTIPSGIDRNIFNSWRKSYWKNRVNDFK